MGCYHVLYDWMANFPFDCSYWRLTKSAVLTKPINKFSVQTLQWMFNMKWFQWTLLSCWNSLVAAPRYSSRILSTQRRELWQNTRERRVIACLLAQLALQILLTLPVNEVVIVVDFIFFYTIVVGCCFTCEDSREVWWGMSWMPAMEPSRCHGR